jgi:pimeloyl-ACP methyl ester carboxylesterase
MVGALVACVVATACGEAAPTAAPPPAVSAEPARPTATFSASATTSAAAPSASAAAPAEPPAIGGERFVSLDVPGFAPAVVAVPVGAHRARPIVVATHGNYDRPEWQCEVWADIVGDRAFVLCPRGDARPDSPAKDDIRFTYRSNQYLEREVDAALAALRASPHAPHLAEGPPAWAGFSLGAIMGVAIAARRPADFSVLFLVEGGVDRFTDEVSRTFAKGGGKAVLFACAQAGCGKTAQKRADRLTALGVRTRVVDAGNLGHRYDGPVADGVKAALPEFLEGETRFQP